MSFRRYLQTAHLGITLLIGYSFFLNSQILAGENISQSWGEENTLFSRQKEFKEATFPVKTFSQTQDPINIKKQQNEYKNISKPEVTFKQSNLNYAYHPVSESSAGKLLYKPGNVAPRKASRESQLGNQTNKMSKKTFRSDLIYPSKKNRSESIAGFMNEKIRAGQMLDVNEVQALLND